MGDPKSPDLPFVDAPTHLTTLHQLEPISFAAERAFSSDSKTPKTVGPLPLIVEIIAPFSNNFFLISCTTGYLFMTTPSRSLLSIPLRHAKSLLLRA